MSEEQLPMNDIERPVDAPPADQGGQQPTEQQQRERDESGRFAPRQNDQPRGQPNAEAARRREAQERDEARAERDRYKADHEALKKRLDDMGSLLKGEQQEAAPDPIAELAKKVDGIAETFQQRQEREQAEQAWTQVRTYADQDEARFTAQQPDFPQATEHYIMSRLHEMKALGIEQQDAAAILQQEAQQLLHQCAQAGRSPAEMLYGMAQARGYQAGAASAPQQSPMRNVTPQAPAGGRSFGTGAGPGSAALTAQQIANMPDDDYNAFRSTPEGRRAIKRAMGAS
jgi:hypothetical protein